jgi:hypothetical protein
MNETDDDLIAGLPEGQRFNLISAALAKRMLQTQGITVGQRLRLLELMNACTDLYFTADMLATVQPMTEIEFEIYSAAASLDSKDRSDESFKILTSPRVFGFFVKLNPSMMAAIKLKHDGSKPKCPI